jgi:pimeloyl-ACP methyl ester carboxylesterase
MNASPANRPHNSPRRWIAVVAALALVPSAFAVPASAAAATAGPAAAGVVDTVRVPRLSWAPCGPSAPDFQCATAQVPLDYDNPDGGTISLALSRIRATDPSRRIGSLFLNPGGPGGSGVDFVQRVGKTLYSPDVRARFDLVGFDPRGVAGSTPLLCFRTQEEAAAVTAPFPFPVTRAEERVWERSDRAYAQACVRNAGVIIDHMSTANVARDMDLLRRAVGDQKMTFAGYSYGSYVGSVYANMFPTKVRAVVIDGVIDPVSDATGRGDEWKRLPVDARLVSEQGAYQTLREFLRLCDLGGKNCAFSEGDPRRRFDRLAARLLRNPVTVPDGNGGTIRVTYADMVSTTLGALYSPSRWPALAEFLQSLDTARGSITPATLEMVKRARAETPYTQGAEGFYGVWCTDSLIPDHFSAWARAARAADRRWPYFGRAWNWGSSICAVWPGQDTDRYLGPFTRRTANPVLVVGIRYDPATRYEDAVSTARILARARLLTVHGWGHTSLFKSSCADRYASSYLLTGALPRPGTVCPVDTVPFQQPASQARPRSPQPDIPWGPPSRRPAR